MDYFDQKSEAEVEESLKSGDQSSIKSPGLKSRNTKLSK